MKISRRTILYILLALILIAIGYGFMPKAVPVETADVKRGYMKVTVDEEGKTRVKNRFIISAPVAGFALRIDIDAGDPVKKGQVVTELEPLRPAPLDSRSRAEAEASVSAAEAALGAAQKNVQAALASAEFAEKEFRRITKLFQAGLVPKERLDRAETEKERADAALESAEFQVDVAMYEVRAALASLKYSAAAVSGENVGKVTVRSPVRGSVLRVDHESEGVVREGQSLIEIGDPRILEVEVDVLSADAVRIKPGMRVLFRRWGGEEELEGRVRIVEPSGFTKISALGVEEQRVLVISDITSLPEKWMQLGDAYRVEASFIIWENSDVLQVPTSALFRYEEGWAAFVVENKKARLRKVETGRNNGLNAEILSGLSEGEKVLTHPDESIEDGTRVRVR